MQPVSRRPPPVDVAVVGVEELPGSFLRVTLSGEGLADFQWPGAASHLKLRPSGVPAPLDGIPGRPPSRTYTPRRLVPATATLDLEIFLHDGGLASDWARRTGPGDRVQVSRPRASYRPDPDTPAMLLAGDDSAVPAVATILEANPHLSAWVLIESTQADGRRAELPEHPDAAVQWLAADPATPGAVLERALREQRFSADTAVWVACEALAVRSIRRYLLEELAHRRDRLVTRGYWRLGEANHPDHDFGEEPITA